LASEIAAARCMTNFRLRRPAHLHAAVQTDLHVRGVNMSKIRTPGRITVSRLFSNRTWSAFAVGAMMIAIAPTLVVSQPDRADDPWKEPWPVLLGRPAAVEPELAALQRRIDASLERLLKPDGATPPSEPL
jgi:hypothetical protein